MKFDYDSTYFDPTAVLECGQVFRFHPYKAGYRVYSADKACYIYVDGARTVVESDDSDYFYRYFDLERDYAAIIDRARAFNVPALSAACNKAKGLRILNQDGEETIFSFIVSQNNNIPRIKGIISRICEGLGEKRRFMGEDYYTFPTAAALAAKEPGYFKALGAGYRDVFLSETAIRIAREGIERLRGLSSEELKRELITYKGIGPKVADCICLFGFGKTDSFPVDTWVERLYREDFGGTMTDRKRINAYFKGLFGQYSGYVQQYLFYAKRQNL